MIKVRLSLYSTDAHKSRKIAVKTKTFDNIYEAYREAHLTVFYLPSNMELSVETCDKTPKELAVFVGMEGTLDESGSTGIDN